MRKINLPKDLLYELYVNQKLTTYQIADELGVARQTICNKLKSYSIELRDSHFKAGKRKLPKKIPEYTIKEKFEKKYKELKSIDLVAQYYNINVKTAYLWKKKHGIEIIKAYSYKAVQRINEGKPWCVKETLEKMYSQYSSRELAIMWNCHPTTVLKWLKKFKIPRRSYSEQWDLKTKAGRHLIVNGKFNYQEYKSIYNKEGLLSKTVRNFIINTVGECQACGCKEVLDLHHINGNHRDNRAENQAILCPNCHAKIHRLGYTLEELCPNFKSWDKLQKSYADAK